MIKLIACILSMFAAAIALNAAANAQQASLADAQAIAACLKKAYG